jgi:hypothetical protein
MGVDEAFGSVGNAHGVTLALKGVGSKFGREAYGPGEETGTSPVGAHPVRD